MPRVLYDHVIEVEERVIPHKQCDVDANRRTVDLENKQSVTKLKDPPLFAKLVAIVEFLFAIEDGRSDRN